MNRNKRIQEEFQRDGNPWVVWEDVIEPTILEMSLTCLESRQQGTEVRIPYGRLSN